MSPSLLDFLKHIEHECSFILRVSKGKNREEILNDELLCKGLVRSIEIIGEAAKNLPSKLKEKYPKTDYNETHILKSLVYFEDADNQPSPRMHKDASWDEVRRGIIEKVKEFKL